MQTIEVKQDSEKIQDWDEIQIFIKGQRGSKDIIHIKDTKTIRDLKDLICEKKEL